MKLTALNPAAHLSSPPPRPGSSHHHLSFEIWKYNSTDTWGKPLNTLPGKWEYAAFTLISSICSSLSEGIWTQEALFEQQKLFSFVRRPQVSSFLYFWSIRLNWNPTTLPIYDHQHAKWKQISSKRRCESSLAPPRAAAWYSSSHCIASIRPNLPISQLPLPSTTAHQSSMFCIKYKRVELKQ